MRIKRTLEECMVCGDKGTGRNYGIITCLSCKAFFMRTIKNNMLYDCPSNGKCVVNPITRKICKKCRLDKCFGSGMKKELYGNGKERHSIENTTKLNQQKRKFFDMETTVPSEDSDCDNKLDVFIDVSSMAKRIRSQMQRYLPDYKGFNDLEINRVSELSMALNVFNYPKCENTIEVYSFDDYHRISSAIFETELHKLITFVKSLHMFADMNENDQLALVKYGCIDICSTVSAKQYIGEYPKYWTIFLDNGNSYRIKTKLLLNENKRIAKFSPKLIQFVTKSEELSKMWFKLNMDSNAINIITAIQIFNPDHPNLVRREYVKLQQKLYIYLLQRYLQSKYHSKCEANELMSNVMNIIKETNELRLLVKNDMDAKALARQYSHNYSPFLKEIFDME